ncbi:MAG: type II toxin-antitoxin system HicA family toxin [Methanoregulaceae archaeon]|nr:type II toxin-antitoxin system HicA family toxin [Methanoregulaceae archaeon]
MGWQFARQTGSHIVLKRQGSSVVLSVPNHRALDRGTLRSLIRLAGLSVDEFRTALRGS